jgi:hypothetical protein
VGVGDRPAGGETGEAVRLAERVIVLSPRPGRLGGDVAVDRSGGRAVAPPPDLFEQLLPGQHHPGALGEALEQIEFRRGQVHLLITDGHAPAFRIDRAAHLLSSTAVPLADVAAAAGFYDQAAFTRTFARLTGETPSVFPRRSRSA